MLKRSKYIGGRLKEYGRTNMAKSRHVYPGGNTRYGFHSFYDQIVTPEARAKIILKGGPGVGKSYFMKTVAGELNRNGIELEYHWCSSDTDSLDAIVAGNGQLCILDGTAPHMVDPRYPGAYDWIINLGDYWDATMIAENKHRIIELSQQKSMSFERAYNRLRETAHAWWEWGSFYSDLGNKAIVNRNILALAEDFLQGAPKSNQAPRHLFAAALTPEGIVSKADSLLDNSWAIYAVKGSPASGVKALFSYIESMVQLENIYAELFHCPFDPANLDLIMLPAKKAALLDISGHIVDYTRHLAIRHYKHLLDFDQFLNAAAVSACAEPIAAAQERFAQGLQQALLFLAHAKQLHGELESNYIPAMNFERIEAVRNDLTSQILAEFSR